MMVSCSSLDDGNTSSVHSNDMIHRPDLLLMGDVLYTCWTSRIRPRYRLISGPIRYMSYYTDDTVLHCYASTLACQSMNC